MKKQKMNTASTKQDQASRVSVDKAERGMGSKPSSDSSAHQSKKAPTSTSQSGAAVKSKTNK